MLYKWKCGCGRELSTTSGLNDQPPTTGCECGTIHSSAEIDISAEHFGYQDGSPKEATEEALLPKHRRIRKPMDPKKMQRYKDLEKAEQQRIRRMDGEDDET